MPIIISRVFGPDKIIKASLCRKRGLEMIEFFSELSHQHLHASHPPGKSASPNTRGCQAVGGGEGTSRGKGNSLGLGIGGSTGGLAGEGQHPQFGPPTSRAKPGMQSCSPFQSPTPGFFLGYLISQKLQFC